MKTLALKFPFSFGDRQVTELSFDRLKGKHLKNVSPNPTMPQLMELASKSSKEPPALFDEMDAEDVAAALEIVGDFFGGSRKTGEDA